MLQSIVTEIAQIGRMKLSKQTKRKLLALEVSGFASLFFAFVGHNHIDRAYSERAGMVFIVAALLSIGILWRVGRHLLMRSN